MIQKILGLLRPFLPLLVTGGVILCCAAAPELADIPARKAVPDSSELQALLQETEDVRNEQAAKQTEAAEETTEAKPETDKNKTEKNKTEPVVAEELAAGTGDYEDGTYTGSGTGYGGTISVQVTVKNAQITDITILSASGETSSFLAKAKGVIQSILKTQTWEVDAVSGATYSSNGIKAAVKNALTGEVTNSALGSTQTATGNSAALTMVTYEEPSGYVDGTYTGSAQGFGGTITVQVTIADGELTGIQVLSAAGETSAYLSRAMSVLNTILSSQSPNVDTVSGATYSSSGIINAVKNALASASADGGDPDGENSENAEEPENPDAEQPADTGDQTADPDGPESLVSPREPENRQDQDDQEKADDTTEPAAPENTENTEVPVVTTETTTETFSGSGTVVPDENEDFAAYSITVTVEVSVTVKTTIADGTKTVETTRSVTGFTVSGASGSNAAFTGRALAGMQAALIASGAADTVSGATCSSAGIRAAYAAAIAGAGLGTTTEITETEKIEETDEIAGDAETPETTKNVEDVEKAENVNPAGPEN